MAPPGPGRPRKDPDLKTRCRDLTSAALERLEAILRDGKDREAISAGEIILAYAWGRPEGMSKVELSGAGGKEIVIRWMSEKDGN
jgi:hypothetical protein